jgi:cold shock CspA family protein
MTESQEVITGDRLTGMVKWFNNKAGFGFITVCGDGEFGGKDIFTHYSSIRVNNTQYKYLVQGEYVDFNLIKSENDKHEYQAVDISGVKGGAIMCETRKMALGSRPARPEFVGRPEQSGRPEYTPRPNREQPSDESFVPEDNEGFSKVEKAPRKRAPVGARRATLAK